MGSYNKRCREDECLLDAFNPVSLGISRFCNDKKCNAGIYPTPIYFQHFGFDENFSNIYLGTKGYMIDTRTSSAITASKMKGGGIEVPSCYPRWKRINRSKDSGPTRYYYLLESYSKVTNKHYV